MNQDWLAALAALRDARTPAALVVVTEIDGSAPREPGARMIVAGGRLVFGTIGGGNLEKLAIEHATALLEAGGPRAETRRYPLGERTGQCCGGAVTLFFETHRWDPATVAIFGAGHVGQALGGLAPYLGARVVLIDSRAEEELVPAVPAARPYELVCADAPEAELDLVPPDTLVVIMTHSHALDLALVEAALRRGSFPYLGLIGSERKWERFRSRLRQRGFSAEQIASVRCPIGVDKHSKDPRAIALSVAAELTGVLAAGTVPPARADG